MIKTADCLAVFKWIVFILLFLTETEFVKLLANVNGGIRG